MGKLTMKVLGFEAGQAFSEFKRFVIQDGSSFALTMRSAHLFPGRFHASSRPRSNSFAPWMCSKMPPITIALSPDTDAEHDYLPDPERLRGDVFLADAGVRSIWPICEKIARHGGFFLVRGKAVSIPV